MMIERLHGDGDPEWRPLEAILPLEKCKAFMYMGWLELDDRRLHHYKHGITRGYVFVTDGLETYRYSGGSMYVPHPRKAAIRYALKVPVFRGAAGYNRAAT